MIAAPIRVVLDANVLFPFTLRDTLLRAAAKGYFRGGSQEELNDHALGKTSTIRVPAIRLGVLFGNRDLTAKRYLVGNLDGPDIGRAATRFTQRLGKLVYRRGARGAKNRRRSCFPAFGGASRFWCSTFWGYWFALSDSSFSSVFGVR